MPFGVILGKEENHMHILLAIVLGAMLIKFGVLSALVAVMSASIKVLIAILAAMGLLVLWLICRKR